MMIAVALVGRPGLRDGGQQYAQRRLVSDHDDEQLAGHLAAPGNAQPCLSPATRAGSGAGGSGAGDSANRRSAIVAPAGSRIGGVSSTPAMRAVGDRRGGPEDDDDDKMAVVLIPNKMMANGNQAIDGIVCSPVMSEPTAARSGPILNLRRQRVTTPMSTARPKPMTARSLVVAMACHSRA